jgi:secondary thiamine-phosphate synthase enzyme
LEEGSTENLPLTPTLSRKGRGGSLALFPKDENGSFYFPSLDARLPVGGEGDGGEGEFKNENARAVMIYSETISFSTKGFSDMIDVTDRVDSVIRRSKIGNGLVTVFCPGSTGAVTTIEYESGVLRDLQKAIDKIVPSNIPYEHDKRWADGNGFSHVRAALMKPSLTIPIIQGKLTLGTWQQIVFIDFDNRKRERNLLVHIIGE